MSRKSKAEYIAVKRKSYTWASRAKRTRILDDACGTLGFSRKFVIKLLTGNLEYRAHKGRGKTYDEDVIEAARKIWVAIGSTFTTYFVAWLPRLIPEYEL